MATYALFRHPSNPNDDGFYRVARQTLDMPGRMPLKDWSLVPCDTYGSPSYGGRPILPLDSFGSLRTRAEVENAIMRRQYALYVGNVAI